MTDAHEISRRTLLVGGVGAAALLAGCQTGRKSAEFRTADHRSLRRPLPHRRPSSNPYLSGNFAPVDTEMTKRRLPVEGSIPTALRGTLLRNGPNPISPDPAMYHWFTGDGMLHAIELHSGEARYRNRWVRTDTAAGLLGERPIVDQPSDPNPVATNRAQTSIVSHAGKTLALYEASLPTEVTTELETVGRYDFGGALRTPMTAHPKIDPVTGEMLFFAYDTLRPYVYFHVVDRHGQLVHSTGFPIPRTTMMHDFAVTKRNVVFLDLPVVFDLSTFGHRPFPAEWKPEHGARIGVMPRDASTPPRWFDIEPCYVFHTVNAYDDGHSIVVDVVRHEQMFSDDIYGIADGTGTLDRWTVDLRTGKVGEARIDDRTQEFPRVDPRTVGRRHRYAYTVKAHLDDFVRPFGTLFQHDLEAGTSTPAKLGRGMQAGEGVFVPAGTKAREDEGWVLSVVYNAIEDRSDLVILDATDFGGPPVATVALPQRVPFGFHGIWEPAPQ